MIPPQRLRGGGVLFGGDVAGRFRAFDQKTGAILWEVNLGSQATGFPISYAINGRQYIAVSTGQAVNSGGYLRMTPEIRVGQSNSLYPSAQIEAGRKLYVEQQCATCHGAEMKGTNAAPALADDGFRGAWRTRTLPELLECTRSTMPPGRVGALGEEQYQSLIAAILEANGLN